MTQIPYQLANYYNIWITKPTVGSKHYTYFKKDIFVLLASSMSFALPVKLSHSSHLLGPSNLITLIFQQKYWNISVLLKRTTPKNRFDCLLFTSE